MTDAVHWSSFFVACSVTILCTVVVASDSPVHPVTTNYLQFSGDGDYVEIPSAPDLSFSPQGLTVSAWLKPDALEFSKGEGSGYVYWIGKGDKGRYEWAARMYSHTNRENPPRPNRISFYMFDAEGGLGQGSYVQEPVTAGQWIQITASANGRETAIYRNSEYVRCDEYDGPAGHGCQAHPERIEPTAGNAPLRFGTRDLRSFFQGGLSQVRIWNRTLSNEEIRKVFEGDVPRAGLVAEFLLNEGKGDIVHDTAGSREGRIVGARWVRSQ